MAGSHDRIKDMTLTKEQIEANARRSFNVYPALNRLNPLMVALDKAESKIVCVMSTLQLENREKVMQADLKMLNSAREDLDEAIRMLTDRLEGHEP